MHGYKKSKTAFSSLIKVAPKILFNVKIKVRKQNNVLLIDTWTNKILILINIFFSKRSRSYFCSTFHSCERTR